MALCLVYHRDKLTSTFTM